MSSAVRGHTVLSTLGKGSFGVVYKVRRDEDGKVFALKDIKIPFYTRDRERMEREVNSHRSLPKHPNILDFIDYTRDKHVMHIVLEYCELGNLEEYVTKRQPDFTTSLSFMVDMSRGLNHLHFNGIVHRDIKPENILLTQGRHDFPQCKISDFGVANMSTYQPEQLQDEASNDTDYFSTLCGTPLYLAPEVTERRYTKACDVFSLGVVFYILFSTERTKQGQVAPWAKDGTIFYRAKDKEIQEQIRRYVKDEKLFELMSAMLRVDYHDRISAPCVEEKLMGIATSDDEVFLVTMALICFIIVVFLFPPALALLCLCLAVVVGKEFLPSDIINTRIIPTEARK